MIECPKTVRVIGFKESSVWETKKKWCQSQSQNTCHSSQKRNICDWRRTKWHPSHHHSHPLTTWGASVKGDTEVLYLQTFYTTVSQNNFKWTWELICADESQSDIHANFLFVCQGAGKNQRRARGVGGAQTKSDKHNHSR